MSEMRSPWRKCLSLLQLQTHCRATLLQIHAFMLRNSLETNRDLVTKLITKLSSADPRHGTLNARQLFDQLPQKSDSFLCDAMMKSHLSSRQFSEAIHLYASLRRKQGFVPDAYTFLTLTKSCSLKFSIWEGMEVHAHVLRYGFSSNLYVATAFVDMYGKLGLMGFARKLFDEMTERSSVSWGALMTGYIRAGDMGSAKTLFDVIPEDEKHECAFNVMVDGYVKLGKLTLAKMLFDAMPRKNLVSWNIMIRGYVKLGEMRSAKLLFDAMPEKTMVSWNTMINGYVKLGDMRSAKMLFNTMPEKNVVSWNTMIDGHVKLGDVKSAKKLFDAMPDKDMVSWNTMIDGYVKLGEMRSAKVLLDAMPEKNTVSWNTMIDGYVKLGDMRSAKMLFDTMPEKDVMSWTTIIDGYVKLGEIEKAKRVFYDVQARDVCAWTVLINGLALNGCAEEALEVFVEMMRKGFNPNESTMLAVLSACNHGGLVEEGKKWFTEMGAFGLTPKIEHYGCLVDLLGRAGRLEEAERLVGSMPYETNEIILSSLLSACRYANDITRAEKVVKKAISMDLCEDSSYFMLRNLYAVERKWRDVEKVKMLMVTKGAQKWVGRSAIEINSQILEFVAGDNKHSELTHLVLDRLQIHMKVQEKHFAM